MRSKVTGGVFVDCQLSGTPDLVLKFTNASMIDDASFHPCVRLKRYEREKVVSFIPPDGKFKLMEFRFYNLLCKSSNKVQNERKYYASNLCETSNIIWKWNRNCIWIDYF